MQGAGRMEWKALLCIIQSLKESRSFKLRSPVNAESSEAEVQVQSVPDARLEKVYISPTKKQQIPLHHLVFSSLFLT